MLSEVSIEPTGQRKDDVGAHASARRVLRAGDRVRAVGLAPVPARLGGLAAGADRVGVPVRLGGGGRRPGARAQPGGPAPRSGHEATVLAPSAIPPAEPWVRSVGRPLRVPYRGTVAPSLRSRTAGRARRSRRCVRRRPRPRAADAERVDVRDAHVVRAGRRDGPRLPRPVAGDGAVGARAPPRLGRDRDRRGGLPGGGLVPPAAVPEAALEIVPNGVDVRAFAWTPPARDDLPDGRRILWVNRLDAQKGFPIAARGVLQGAGRRTRRRLRRRGRGQGPGGARPLTASARERVEMRGTVPNAEVPSFLAGARSPSPRPSGRRASGSCWWSRWRRASRWSRRTSPATARS